MITTDVSNLIKIILITFFRYYVLVVQLLSFRALQLQATNDLLKIESNKDASLAEKFFLKKSL